MSGMFLIRKSPAFDGQEVTEEMKMIEIAQIHYADIIGLANIAICIIGIILSVAFAVFFLQSDEDVTRRIGYKKISDIFVFFILLIMSVGIMVGFSPETWLAYCGIRAVVLAFSVFCSWRLFTGIYKKGKRRAKK